MKPKSLQHLTAILCMAATTFMLAHSINAIVEYELTDIPSRAPEVAPAAETPPAFTENPQQLAASIKNSGLFVLPAAPIFLADTNRAAAPPKPPLDVKKKVRLLGTILRDHGEAAILEDIGSRQQTLVHLHEEIPDVGEIRSITREGIVIGQDDQEELLPLAILSEESTPSLPNVSSTPGPIAKPFAPRLKRTLDRREVAHAVNDPSKLILQGHAVPHFTNGTLVGFRLDFVQPAGFFDKAGFQYGDVIQRVNGIEIRDPGKLLGIFKQLLDEPIVKVEVMRHSQPTTVIYELR